MLYENMSIKVVSPSNKAARQSGTLYKFQKLKDCTMNYIYGLILYVMYTIHLSTCYLFSAFLDAVNGR